MTTAELLSDLISRGVELQACGDKLRFRPLDRLTATDLENIRQHKPALLRLLRARTFIDRPPVADSRPRQVCNRCGSTDFSEIVIHDGQSLRRDCSQCHRFLGWPRWYSQYFDSVN